MHKQNTFDDNFGCLKENNCVGRLQVKGYNCCLDLVWTDWYYYLNVTVIHNDKFTTTAAEKLSCSDHLIDHLIVVVIIQLCYDRFGITACMIWNLRFVKWFLKINKNRELYFNWIIFQYFLLQEFLKILSVVFQQTEQVCFIETFLSVRLKELRSCVLLGCEF